MLDISFLWVLWGACVWRREERPSLTGIELTYLRRGSLLDHGKARFQVCDILNHEYPLLKRLYPRVYTVEPRVYTVEPVVYGVELRVYGVELDVDGVELRVHCL